MPYFLMFSSHFDRDKKLDKGRLSINHLHKGTIRIWIASSSWSGKQYVESFHERGGYLPPQYRCIDMTKYTVDLLPIALPHVKGVRGNFYKILPYEVTTDRGNKRSDFGIHADTDAPGSLGCIVMSKDRFNQFEDEVFLLRERNLKTIPLFVQYS